MSGQRLLTSLNILRRHSTFTLTCNHKRLCKDNLCFFQNVVCALEMKNLPLKFRPKDIKLSDVKNDYATLRNSCMSELPKICKDFRGFDLQQLDMACQKFEINAYISDCEVTNEGQEGSDGCLNWCNKFVEGVPV